MFYLILAFVLIVSGQCHCMEKIEKPQESSTRTKKTLIVKKLHPWTETNKKAGLALKALGNIRVPENSNDADLLAFIQETSPDERVRLNISGCVNLTSSAVFELVKKSPLLKSVNLSGCNQEQISPDFIEKLQKEYTRVTIVERNL